MTERNQQEILRDIARSVHVIAIALVFVAGALVGIAFALMSGSA